MTFLTSNGPTDYYRTLCGHRRNFVNTEWATAVKSVGPQQQLFA